ncbi:MAG: universal stress protein [Pseudolabrys sp.]|nr:universal stress protein [Pseudolabrys sp.]
MRSLLLALDDTPGGAGAANFALYLAAKRGAAVTGASILDVDYLTAPSPGAIGTSHYKHRADSARLKRGRELTEHLFKNFQQHCKARKVSGSVIALEGRPWDQLRTAAGSHDLIMIGHDSDLHGEVDSPLAKTVEKILHENPRALIVTPDAVAETSRIVVAYDGSVPAARSLQIFTLLGLAEGCDLHVISAASTQEAADRSADDASRYLGLYGIACKTRAFASKADPAALVVAEAKALDAEMIVMGAYGHRGWREALLGSFTTRLLSECPTALFIHH